MKSISEVIEVLANKVFTIEGKNRYYRLFEDIIQVFDDFKCCWEDCALPFNDLISDTLTICNIDYTSGVPLSLPVDFSVALHDILHNKNSQYLTKFKDKQIRFERGLYYSSSKMLWKHLTVENAIALEWFKVS